MKRLEYEIFEYQERYYFFDYVNLILMEIDKEIYEGMLKAKLDKGAVPQSEFVNFLHINSIGIDDGEIFRQIDRRKYDVACISFPTEHECNLACKYCFASSGGNYSNKERKMSVDTLNKILDTAYKELFNGYAVIKIDFVSGGEPLVNFEIIKHTVNKTKELYSTTGIKTEIFICTNATLLNDEILDFVDQNNIKLGISLDGIKTSNQNRVYKNGKETFDDVISWIKVIKTSKKWSLKLRDILILSVVTETTKSIVENLKFFKNLGINNVQFKLCRKNKKLDSEVRKTEISRIVKLYDELNDFLMERIQENDLSYLCMILNDNDYYGKIVRRIIMRDISIRRCQAGRNKIAFTANGDMYPCDSFVGLKEFEVKHDHMKVYNPLELNTVKSSTYCQKCQERYICGGDCYHNSYLVNQNISAPDMEYCQVVKHLVQNALRLIACLNSKENGKLLEKIEHQLRIKEKMFV